MFHRATSRRRSTSNRVPESGCRPLPSSGQIPHFPSGPITATLRPSGDKRTPAVPSGCDGLGIAAAQINQVIAGAMPGLDSGGQQLFAVRQVANGAVADVVVGQLPGFAGAGWYHAERPALCRFGDHPLVVRRNCLAGAIADPNRRRSVCIAQKYGVVRPAPFRLFLKQNFFAVTADISQAVTTRTIPVRRSSFPPGGMPRIPRRAWWVIISVIPLRTSCSHMPPGTLVIVR